MYFTLHMCESLKEICQTHLSSLLFINCFLLWILRSSHIKASFYINFTNAILAYATSQAKGWIVPTPQVNTWSVESIQYRWLLHRNRNLTTKLKRWTSNYITGRSSYVDFREQRVVVFRLLFKCNISQMSFRNRQISQLRR